MEMDMKRAKSMAIGIAICFLLIHLFIINVFQQCGVTPMVRVNIFSVCFYAFMCFVAYKEWLQAYAVAVYLEVIAHMTLAVIFTGWESGFQVTMIGMSVLAFYSEYVGRELRLRYVRMMPFVMIGMLCYIGSYIYVYYYPALYFIPEVASFWLNLVWGVVVFVITSFVLQLFLMIVRSSENKLEHQMSHDKLTGLPNRYYVSDYMEMLKKKKELKDYWIAIADIDDFKNINDTYGHNCGDYVLQTIADIFTKRDCALCCRWGGEEFIILSPHDVSEQYAYDFLENLRKDVEAYEFRFNGNLFHVTATFGMSSFKPDQGTDAWISDADAKLYQGKKNGKNQVVR